jgi:hypothetical protein
MSYTRSERSKMEGERLLGALDGDGPEELGRVLVVIQLNIQLSLGLFSH